MQSWIPLEIPPWALSTTINSEIPFNNVVNSSFATGAAVVAVAVVAAEAGELELSLGRPE
jgi:hypothetical protein